MNFQRGDAEGRRKKNENEYPSEVRKPTASEWWRSEWQLSRSSPLLRASALKSNSCHGGEAGPGENEGDRLRGRMNFQRGGAEGRRKKNENEYPSEVRKPTASEWWRSEWQLSRSSPLLRASALKSNSCHGGEAGPGENEGDRLRGRMNFQRGHAEEWRKDVWDERSLQSRDLATLLRRNHARQFSLSSPLLRASALKSNSFHRGDAGQAKEARCIS